ncbi:MAG: Ig-like domain-containing protein [Mycolicibacterium vanbaalenii]|uniref:Ig-like domain-containing protein n=1 Tax=Mycolicibacterium vanbaalenii TaxID=110539 RepID=UPI0035667AB8
MTNADDRGPGRLVDAARYGTLAAALAVAAVVTTGQGVAAAEPASSGGGNTAQSSSSESGDGGSAGDGEQPSRQGRDGADLQESAANGDSGPSSEGDGEEPGDSVVGDATDGSSDDAESRDSDREVDSEDLEAEEVDRSEGDEPSAGNPGTVVDPAEPIAPVEEPAVEVTAGAPVAEPAAAHRELAPARAFAAPAGDPADQPAQSAMAWSLLGWVRRNFFNQAPVVDYDPDATTQGPLGVITGSVGATDPEGDELTYRVVGKPEHGTVVIDQQTGTFTYTPDLEWAQVGGTDAFRVRVTDGKLNLLHFLRPDFGIPRVTIGLDVHSIQPSADRFIVPLPDTVRQPQNPAYTADGKALVFRGTPVEGGRSEIYRVNPDGTGLQCLSCGLAPEITENLSKPFVFEDGNRILLSVGTQSDTGGETADHYILECAGGVAACGTGSQLLEITVPVNVPPNVVVVQRQRELRVAPDGLHVGFTQLLSSGTATQLVSSVGRLERTETGYEIVEARVVYVGGELKNFTSDGKGVMITDFSGRYEAGNADNVLVHLADGTVTRLTANLDYDESVDMSPNGQWLAVGSSRTLDYLTPMSQIVRPTFVPAYVVFPTFQAKKGSLNQAWVVSTEDELNRANGIFLGDTSGAYNSVPVANWSPDGSQVAFWERSKTDPGDTRLVVATLNSIDGGTRADDVSTPETSSWAQPLSAVVVTATPTEPSRAGRVGGTAVVTSSKTGNLTTTTVTYTDFEDEAGFILNGTETTVANATLTNITYSADVTVTGADGNERGYLRADGVKIVNQLSMVGTVESSIDGNHLVMGSPAP